MSSQTSSPYNLRSRQANSSSSESAAKPASSAADKSISSGSSGKAKKQASPSVEQGKGASDIPPQVDVDGSDILSHLQKRHREVDAMLSVLEKSDDVERRREVLDQVVHDLAVHTAVEELLFYPAIQRELGEKDPKKFSKDVLHMLEEHHAAKSVLDELYAMGPKDDRFQARAGVLAENIRHHVEEEEEIFPDLRRHWSADRLRELGDEFIAAEKWAPTRPHPNLPDQGRFVASMQLVAAAFDKVRDAARDAIHSITPSSSS